MDTQATQIGERGFGTISCVDQNDQGTTIDDNAFIYLFFLIELKHV